MTSDKPPSLPPSKPARPLWLRIIIGLLIAAGILVGLALAGIALLFAACVFMSK